MKKRKPILCMILVVSLLAGTLGFEPCLPTGGPFQEGEITSQAAGAAPVKRHGRLHVSGTDLVDSHGQKVQLKGVSTHGIAWFPQYVNKAAFQTLRDRYGINLIRLAMYPEQSEGYNSSVEKKVQEGVRYATELGMYVIIDWHVLSQGNPMHYKKRAAKFFRKMAKKYKKQKNVLYEICNEPNGNITWERNVKPYAKKVIGAIRSVDKKAVIIVGTPTWSQDVDIVANSPIRGRRNIMYSLHFYAATHTDWNRDKVVTAHKKGLPIFATEFSISEASGTGRLDKASGNRWMKLLNQYNISYAAWSLCNKDETSALLAPGCSKTSGWSKKDFSAAGRWYLSKVR